MRNRLVLDFHDDGHDEGAAAGGFLDEALEVDAHFFFDHAVVGLLLAAEAVEGFEHHFAGLLSDVGAAAESRISHLPLIFWTS